ncbi:hypothetical protein RhiirA4_486252 [Rhizophagus irregularis]|uniref:Uncharacterized protein n=1 Tax=Rhizophagus irregularis TaxID=588596 RepID=A0A2I1HR55_9GLOM|nr:hypothetical protein RhiirA4_486252 [Rhizophagus irregularis]
MSKEGLMHHFSHQQFFRSLNVGLMVCSSLGWNIERQKKKASRYCAYNEAAEYFHIILSDMKSDDRIKL